MSRESLESIFSQENMLKYAEACLDLSVNVPERQQEKDFDTLLIPSRGALPFFLGMVHGLKKFSALSPTHDNFYKNLGVQPILAPLLPNDEAIIGGLEKKSVKVLLVPFTADLNIERIYPEEKSEEYTANTRNYWAKVVTSFFKTPSDRHKNPSFKTFVDIILKKVEGRQKVAEMYESFPKVNGFSMIDTVISGRASYEILTSFDNLCVEKNNHSLKPQSAFLIVDENGRKLRTPYLPYLQLCRGTGQVEMQKIPRIVSEDKGASLLGVASVVYPSIMKDSKNMFSPDGKPFFIGAGSWRLCSDLNRDNFYFDNFNKFMDLVYRAIDNVYTTGYEGIKNSPEAKKFEESRQNFIINALERNIFAEESHDKAILGLNPKYPIKTYFETGSKVVHVEFEPSATHKLMCEIQRETGLNYLRKNECDKTDKIPNFAKTNFSRVKYQA